MYTKIHTYNIHNTHTHTWQERSKPGSSPEMVACYTPTHSTVPGTPGLPLPPKEDPPLPSDSPNQLARTWPANENVER